jgi:hypothetical protein
MREAIDSIAERQRLERALLDNLKKQRPALHDLLERINDKWCYEDGLYRFYHQSFKVFNLQEATLEMVKALKKVSPQGTELCPPFQQILATGTGRQFQVEDNQNWVERTAPIVQAFLHARYFLEMAVKYSGGFGRAAASASFGLGRAA